MERVRLMGWCSTCVSGMYLPGFAVAEGGLFAERGLEVEFVGCARAPDWSLQGFTARPKAVAAGDADYTAATHGLSVFAGERLYRPELLAPAREHATA